MALSLLLYDSLAYKKYIASIGSFCEANQAYGGDIFLYGSVETCHDVYAACGDFFLFRKRLLPFAKRFLQRNLLFSIQITSCNNMCNGYADGDTDDGEFAGNPTAQGEEQIIRCELINSKQTE